MASDLDLIQALYQTKRSLSPASPDADDHVRPLADKVDGLLARYQLEDRGMDDAAYAEQGADLIDNRMPGSAAAKGQVQAALVAYADMPTGENAAHAEAAIDRLSAEIDDA